tara:strand:+ start:7128 stop:7331 length:204 start_codon:yes stop_codon:yes gene_type:complete
MSLIAIIFTLLSITFFVYFILLKKNQCTTDECNDSRIDDIVRAKMNLDPKWNKGCVRDPKTGHFKRK